MKNPMVKNCNLILWFYVVLTTSDSRSFLAFMLTEYESVKLLEKIQDGGDI
jgi:hypothetical protein